MSILHWFTAGASGNIYHMRGDGTAANKAAADGTGGASTFMDCATHNGETFVADDVLEMHDGGGKFVDAILVPPSIGSVGHPIVYRAATGDTPIISARDEMATWVESELQPDTFNSDYDGWTNSGTTRDTGIYQGASGASVKITENDTLEKATGGNWASFEHEFYFYVGAEALGNNQQMPMIQYEENGNWHFIVALRQDGSGDLRIRTEGGGTTSTSSTTILSTGTWYKCNVTCTVSSGSSGSLLVEIDDTTEINLTSIDTMASGTNEYITDVAAKTSGWNWSATEEWYFDTTRIVEGSGFGQSDVYEKTGVTTEPSQVYLDGVLAAEGSLGSLSDHEWVWDTNVLYVRDDTGDPDVTGVVVEATQRDHAISLVGMSYLTFDGVEFESGNQAGRGVVDADTTNVTGVTFTGCAIRDTAYHGLKFYTFGGTIDTIEIDGCTVTNVLLDLIDINGDSTPTVQNLTITDNVLTGATAGVVGNTAMYFNNVSGGTNAIQGNTISQLGEWGLAWTDGAGGDWTISDNSISDWDRGAVGDRGAIHPIDISGNGTWLIERNTIFDGNGDGASAGLYPDTFTGSPTITFHRNYVYDCNGSGTLVTRTSGAVYSYNIFENNGTTTAFARNHANIEVWGDGAGASDDNEFYNNVCYSDTADDGYGVYLVQFVSGNIFKNNIFWHDRNTGQEYVKNSADATAVFDFNCYWPAVGTNEIEYDSTWYSSVSAFNSGESQEGDGIEDNPDFVDAANGNFYSGPTSPCIDAATDLSYTEDYAGYPVPG